MKKNDTHSDEILKLIWNSDTQYALGFYRQLTKMLGIWPLEHNRRISNLQVAVNSVLQLTVIIIFVNNLITKGNCSVVTDIVDALSLIATSILSIMKIVLPIIYQESMYFIVHSAVNDWASVGHGKHREIMIRYAYIGRIVFMVQMIGAYMTIIPLIFGNLPSINPVLNGANDNTTIVYRNIPIGPNCWVSAHLSTNVYLAYYFLITLHLIILCTAYIGGDVYIFGIAMHVCGQFQLLYDNMEKLNANEIYFVQRINLSRLCQRHNHLVKLTNEFERTFNFVLLIQVIASTFIIGISSILLLLGIKNGDNDIVIASLIRIYLLYFQLFIYSYIGDQLSAQSNKLQTAIYNCAWYNMSPDIVRDLSFMILRNNYPFYLTAGKILKLNISSFKELVKTMFSYFSVFRLIFAP